ncbi:Tim10/DDP family zinc finger protein, partial [Vararia minispora EC-137]
AFQKEMEQFLLREQTKARMQASIHQHTSMCWDKCITGAPSARLSRSEENCLANCVERFLDTSLFMVKKLEEQR